MKKMRNRAVSGTGCGLHPVKWFCVCFNNSSTFPVLKKHKAQANGRKAKSSKSETNFHPEHHQNFSNKVVTDKDIVLSRETHGVNKPPLKMSIKRDVDRPFQSGVANYQAVHPTNMTDMAFKVMFLDMAVVCTFVVRCIRTKWTLVAHVLKILTFNNYILIIVRRYQLQNCPMKYKTK
jgi:hypothetical protein